MDTESWTPQPLSPEEVAKRAEQARKAEEERKVEEGRKDDAKHQEEAKRNAEEGKRKSLVAQFVGRWRIKAIEGEFIAILSDTFNVTNASEPKAKGRWEIVGDDARIVWESSEWKIMLRPREAKAFVLRPGMKWTDPLASEVPALKEPDEVPKAVVARFVGRWELLDQRGVPSSYLEIYDSFTASRDHTPGVIGKWHIVGDEARIAWEDGIRDVLRLNSDKIFYLGLGKVVSWDVRPSFNLTARWLSSVKEEKDYEANGLVLVQRSVKGANGEFSGEITGTVVNRRGRKLSSVQIVFSLYDANGGRVGSAVDIIHGLEAGERWNFKATYFNKGARNYKVSELKGY